MQSFGAATHRDRLIASHAEAARRIALRMARRCPDWIAREDLVAAGMVGLIEAADRYDESRQEPFISFAEHRIRVTDFRTELPTLEDVFLRLTGRSIRE